ncbi:metal-dependent hydrolase [Patescibacteria group bacterium]|nr:metal-dependent hydrolase [Patescibacteria group bacterium]MBU1868069.1 metal-dependent hydrolase [Patescibacteria group bacterium]
MPDLTIHLLTTYIANHKLKLNPYFILVGGIFPDLLGRPLIILLPQNYLFSWVSVLLHTPVPVFLLAYVASLLFTEFNRKEVFAALSVGALGHMLLDMTQKHYGDAYYWLFPFSFKTFDIPLLWSDEYILAIPVFAVAAGLIWVAKKYRYMKTLNHEIVKT